MFKDTTLKRLKASISLVEVDLLPAVEFCQAPSLGETCCISETQTYRKLPFGSSWKTSKNLCFFWCLGRIQAAFMGELCLYTWKEFYGSNGGWWNCSARKKTRGCEYLFQPFLNAFTQKVTVGKNTLLTLKKAKVTGQKPTVPSGSKSSFRKPTSQSARLDSQVLWFSRQILLTQVWLLELGESQMTRSADHLVSKYFTLSVGLPCIQDA